jgi:hypothetical protein
MGCHGDRPADSGPGADDVLALKEKGPPSGDVGSGAQAEATACAAVAERASERDQARAPGSPKTCRDQRRRGACLAARRPSLAGAGGDRPRRGGAPGGGRAPPGDAL